LAAVDLPTTLAQPPVCAQTSRLDAAEPRANLTYRLENQLMDVQVTLCAFAAGGRLVSARTVDLAAASESRVTLAVPAGVTDFSVFYGGKLWLSDFVDIGSCDSTHAELWTRIRETPKVTSMDSLGWKCVPSGASAPEGSCAQTLQAWSPLQTTVGTVKLRINNKGLPGEYRLCFFDEQGVKREDLVVPVAPDGSFEREIKVPMGNYSAIAWTTFGIVDLTARDWVNLSWCKDNLATIVFNFTRVPTGGGGGPAGVQCARNDPAPRGGQAPSTPGPSNGQNQELKTPVATIGVAASMPGTRPGEPGLFVSFSILTIFTGGVAWWPPSRYFVLSLFTRLVRPRILDHHVRARIHDLVRQDPGVFLNRVAEVLELGSGQTHYHVGVMLRHKVLVQVRTGGRRCLFAADDPNARRMHATAVLRRPRESLVFSLVRARPGANLAELAEKGGLTRPNASKAVRRLEAVGLVRRVREAGRTNIYTGPSA
jgi:predicted transcriptional regulator